MTKAVSTDTTAFLAWAKSAEADWPGIARWASERAAAGRGDGPDAHLIALCERAIEADAEQRLLMDRHTRAEDAHGVGSPQAVTANTKADDQAFVVRRLHEAISPIRAETLAGMQAKAKALRAWCGDDHADTVNGLLPSLLADLTGASRPARP